MNGLEYAQKMVALWRSARGNQTTHNWCQSFEGYYGQWAYQGNENGIRVYYNATAAADDSSMFTTNVNDANIQPGDQLFWWYAVDGHVCTAVGRDESGRVLVTNTANMGDVVENLGNNVSITHADSLGLTFRGASRTNGANSARPGIVSWPVSYPATSASSDAHPLPTQKTVQEDDMAGLIQHKDRGIALIAPGYFKAVTPEELPIAVSRYGWPKIYDDSQVGAREFDLDVSLAVNGAGGDQQVRSELERSRDAVLKAINGMRGSV